MMLRLMGVVALLGAAVSLAGCNAESGNGMAMSTASAAPVRDLPAGAPCADEISQFQAIVKSDRDTGNLEQKVYDQIDRDLSRAEAACAAGRGGEAHSIVVASKTRHGYRV